VAGWMHVTFRGSGVPLEEVVRRIPSRMGRLVFLSALRDPNTGIYCHPLHPRAPERVEANRLLLGMHEDAFRTWLSYGLEEQKADLDLYFSSLDCSKTTVARTWLKLDFYRILLPGSASAVQRQLFLGNVKSLLDLTACEAGTDSTCLNTTDVSATEKPLLTVNELSRFLGISRRTLRLWAELKEVRAVKVGRQWRFTREDLWDWLRSPRGGG